MNSFTSRTRSPQVAITIQGVVLALLGCDFPPAAVTLPRPCLATIRFAAALKTKAPTARLMKLFARIKNPGFHTAYSLIARLLLDAGTGAISSDRRDYAIRLLGQFDPERLSSPQKANYALALAGLGETEAAKEVVRTAYRQDDRLFNVYARIGSQLHRKKKEYDKLIEWLTLDDSVGRLSPAARMSLAYAMGAGGDMDNAAEHVEIAYRDAPALKDGYARIGWAAYWPNKDYPSARKWLRRDEELDRLSPAWKINGARIVALMDGIENAVPLIDQAYADSPAVMNGYAQVAWTRFVTEDAAYEKTLPYFEKDIRLDRLRGDYLLNYAQALAAVGRTDDAEKLVLDAYETGPRLANGFAQCAFYKNFLFEYAPEKALPWFERDRDLDRLKGKYLIHYAVILAALGNLADADATVKQAYKSNSRVENGYSLLGWYHHVTPDRTPEDAFRFFDHDRRLRRTSPGTRNMLAGLHAYLGRRRIAEQAVRKNYSRHADAAAGNMIVGFCDYARNHDLPYLHRMIEKDRELRRLPLPFMTYLRATVLWKTGHTELAADIIKDVAGRSCGTQAYAASWLRRICLPGGIGLTEFITREIKDLFDANLPK